MKVFEFLMYLVLIIVIVLAVNQLQKPADTSVVYVPSRWGYGNWGWGGRIGYNGRGYGHSWGGRGGCGGGRGGCGGGGRGGRGGYGGHH